MNMNKIVNDFPKYNPLGLGTDMCLPLSLTIMNDEHILNNWQAIAMPFNRGNTVQIVLGEIDRFHVMSTFDGA